MKVTTTATAHKQKTKVFPLCVRKYLYIIAYELHDVTTQVSGTCVHGTVKCGE